MEDPVDSGEYRGVPLSRLREIDRLVKQSRTTVIRNDWYPETPALVTLCRPRYMYTTRVAPCQTAAEIRQEQEVVDSAREKFLDKLVETYENYESSEDEEYQDENAD